MNNKIMAAAMTATGIVMSVAIGAGPAGACGFLVAPNGAVELERTTTLASWENGVEHYVTSFEFASDQPRFGSLIPLPAEPTTVERAGDWTLQRLRREVAPVEQTSATTTAAAAAAARPAEVLRQVQIDSLDVTILRGGGAAVAEWATDNGFDIPAGVSDVLEHYAALSPYFMAAKFDANRAAAKNLGTGQGIPIHIEIPLDRPWVPLQILAAGKQAGESVDADVFLLTPGKPRLGRLDRGVTIERSGDASAQLLAYLRSDKNSTWIPEHATLTHIAISARAQDVRQDLVPLVAPVPLAPANPPIAASRTNRALGPALGVLAGAVLAGAIALAFRRRPRGLRPTSDIRSSR